MAEEEKLREQYKAGFKGGPFYTEPVSLPPLTFKEGIDPLVKAVRQEGETMGSKCTDPHPQK